MIKRQLKKILTLILGENYLLNRAMKVTSENLLRFGPEALSAYYKVGTICNVEFVPMFGTLLGAYRNHSFIPFDDDIDMVTDVNNLSEDLILNLKSIGFEIDRMYIGSDFRGCQLPMKYKGVTCDIYYFYPDENGSIHIDIPLALENHDWTYSVTLNLFRSKDIIIPNFSESEQWEICGIDIKIPCSTKEILAKLYGKNFMTPQKGAHADPDVYQSPIYEHFYKCYPLDFVLENHLIDVIRDRVNK